LLATSSVIVREVPPLKITLRPPEASTVFTVPATIDLVADISGPDASVSKVEFFSDSHKLTEIYEPPFQHNWFVSQPGDYRVTAKLTDNFGVDMRSEIVTWRVFPSVPYLADFDIEEGFVIGDLNRQLGWNISQGSAAIVDSAVSASGTQHVSLAPSEPATELYQEFGHGVSSPNVVFVDFYAQPVPGNSPEDGTLFDIDAARISFVKDGHTGNYLLLAGDGVGGGTWRSAISAGASAGLLDETTLWHRITVRLDYITKTWDFYHNGTLIASNLPFRLRSASFFFWFGLKGHSTGTTRLDAIYIGAENPLFNDSDGDGMDDVWEISHGLDPTVNDGANDPDGDGNDNYTEYRYGSHPRNNNTDGDAFDDRIETVFGSDPRVPNTYLSIENVTWLTQSTTHFESEIIVSCSGSLGRFDSPVKNFYGQPIKANDEPGYFVIRVEAISSKGWHSITEYSTLIDGQSVSAAALYAEQYSRYVEALAKRDSGRGWLDSAELSSEEIQYKYHQPEDDGTWSWTLYKTKLLSRGECKPKEVHYRPNLESWSIRTPEAFKEFHAEKSSYYRIVVPKEAKGIVNWVITTSKRKSGSATHEPVDYQFHSWKIDGQISPDFSLACEEPETLRKADFVSVGLNVDSNRDGAIISNVVTNSLNPAIDLTTADLPFRFWINDDDDQTAIEGEDTPGQPSLTADYNNNIVDSVGDLVDFFPVYLDLKQLLTVLPADGSIKYKLKQADGALNFVYTNLTNEYLSAEKRSKAFYYQYKILTTGFGPSFTQGAGEAATQQITASGVDLSEFGPAFLDGIKNNDWGVILIEARQATTEPLVLSVEKSDGTVITEIKLHLKISPVEEMFRHVNLITAPKEYDGSDITPPFAGLREDIREPAGWLDSLTNGKYFVFLHGFNVDGKKARGWNAEVFKRMHALGSKARFVGVSWNGSPPSIIPGKYLDYHKAVFQAFQTGDVLGRALSFTRGADVTLAAHSLGNMVASQAIQNGDYLPSRYYMIDAAVAIEAYSVEDGAGQVSKMVEESWRTYDDDPYPCTRLYASKWHELFPSSDNRSQLTWRKRFESITQASGFAHNFFSGEEDVVANADHIDDASVFELVTSGNISEVIAGEFSWKLQELVKGAHLLSSLAGAVLERRQGGWRFNPDWNILVETHPGPGSTWISRRRLPSDTVSLTTADLQRRTFFFPFLEPKLTAPDASVASAKAGEPLVKYDILARGIPALSNAVAANPLPSLGDERNFNMPLKGRTNLPWPRKSGRWWHSDFKAVALPYVYPMYEAMIARGNLNQ
jgi:hypothetical protein